MPASVQRSAVAAFLAVVLASCGGERREAPDPASEVRAAAVSYLRALEGGSWQRACALLTPGARRDVEDEAGRSCARALASGAVLSKAELETARRDVPGARVGVHGDSATIGPLGDLPEPLRLRQQDGRWLIGS